MAITYLTALMNWSLQQKHNVCSLKEDLTDFKQSSSSEDDTRHNSDSQEIPCLLQTQKFLSHSQKPNKSPYPKTDESNPHSPTLFS
jgi:hypothetical protein